MKNYKNHLALSLFTCFLIILSSCKKDQKPDPLEEVLGTVNGQKIHYKDIQNFIAEDLENHRINLYNIKRKGFERYAEQFVVKKAAQQEGSSPDEYLEFFEKAQPRDITDSERKAYEERLGKLIATLEEDKQNAIKSEIKRNRIERAKRRLVNELKARNLVKYSLAPPPQPLREKKRAEIKAERERKRQEAAKRAQARKNEKESSQSQQKSEK